ncbi:MAG: hypothetical protein ACREJS_13725 [Candidatus Rokuibacteriota bacterium]
MEVLRGRTPGRRKEEAEESYGAGRPADAQKEAGRPRPPGAVIAVCGLVGLFALLIIVGNLAGDDRSGGALVFGIVFALLAIGLWRRVPLAWGSAVVVLTFFLIIGVARAFDEEPGPSDVILWLMIAVPLGLLLLPSARAWRPLKREEDLAPQMAGLPPVSGWHRPRYGGHLAFAFMAGFGLLMAGVGFGVLIGSQGRERMGGLIAGTFGFAVLAASPMFMTWRRPGRVTVAPAELDGRVVNGLRFPYSPMKTKVVIVVGILFGLVGAGLLLLPDALADPGDSDVFLRVIGLVALLSGFGGAWLVLRRGAGEGWYVTLTAEGVAAAVQGNRTFAPWHAIEKVRAFDLTIYTRGLPHHEPFVGLIVGDRDSLEVGAIGRRLLGINRAFGADLSYPVRSLDVEPALLYYAMDYYHRRPGDRHELAEGRALRRLEERRLL